MDGIAKQAGSLAASLKATGVFKDDMWTILNIDAKTGTNPKDVIALLEAISSSKLPPRPSRSENQDTQASASATVPTARSVGYGLGVRQPALVVFAGIYKTVANRRADEGNVELRRRSAAATDCLLTVLAQTYAVAGGRVAMSWKDPKKKMVGGPFARFLCTVWDVLPPAGRPKTAQTFARRAKDEIVPKFRARTNVQRCPHCASIAAERGDGWWRN